MPRGVIRTPAFMPVGTAATVKAMYPDQVEALGADIVLGNTYHLMLRPGAERVARLGGLHRFMNWPYPILTDCGGFQVMSLRSCARSTRPASPSSRHIDGSTHVLTPERSIEIQGCSAPTSRCSSTNACAAAGDESSGDAPVAALGRALPPPSATSPGKALFGIVQGGTDERAARLEREALVGHRPQGLRHRRPRRRRAAGGHAGDARRPSPPHLPADKPRYLMGVGTPDDICSRRCARHRHVRLRDADPRRPPRHRLHPPRPPQPARTPATPTIPAARRGVEMRRRPTYSKAYLHHLV